MGMSIVELAKLSVGSDSRVRKRLVKIGVPRHGLTLSAQTRRKGPEIFRMWNHTQIGMSNFFFHVYEARPAVILAASNCELSNKQMRVRSLAMTKGTR